MRIAIDGNEANITNRVGIGRYAYELIQHLYQLVTQGKTENITIDIYIDIYLKQPQLPDFPPEGKEWRYVVIGPTKLWTQVGLPIHLFRTSRRPDVFFTPTHYGPRFSPVPNVIAIMDLSFIHYPELFTLKDLHQLTHWTNYSVKQAAKIVTISQFTKEDILNTYSRSSEDVVVTYPGYDLELFYPRSTEQIKEMKKRFGLEKNYLLYVGTLQPRKNLIRLIEAFELYLAESPDIDLELVLAGKQGWMYQDILTRVGRSSLKERIHILDFIADKDLPALYSGAGCFILPSFYEGFGLTAIEAMACGTPVVVSNTSCLPEIVGEAGIYVDPSDSSSIAAGFNEVLNFNKRERQAIIKKGLEEVKRFGWQKCAQETLEILITVASTYAQR